MQLSLAIFLSVLGVAGCTASEPRFVCPTPQSGEVAGTIRETSSDIASTAERLSGGNESAISEIAAELRTAHPSASDSAIVNYLVTAYCSTLEAGEPARDKKAALMQFSRRATRAASDTHN